MSHNNVEEYTHEEKILELLDGLQYVASGARPENLSGWTTQEINRRMNPARSMFESMSRERKLAFMGLLVATDMARMEEPNPVDRTPTYRLIAVLTSRGLEIRFSAVRGRLQNLYSDEPAIRRTP